MQTAKLWVALKHSQGRDSSVMLLLHTKNFMDKGVELNWSSAFPHKMEFLYFLLTYMSPVRDGRVVVQVGGVTYQVFERCEEHICMYM